MLVHIGSFFTTFAHNIKNISMRVAQKLRVTVMMLLSVSLQAWADGGSGSGECKMVKIVAERLPDLSIPRHSHCAFFSPQGELTVVGGHTKGFVPTPTAEYLKDGKWQVVPMVYCHDDGVCVPLHTGKVLLAGGYERNLGIGQTFEVEMYDPETHTFNGFGCLDKRRTHVSGVELANGQVVISGNWYNEDAIATWNGGMYFESVSKVSVPRSSPYLFPISDDNIMVVADEQDNYGKPVDASIVDRMKGESFRVPLLEEWTPILLHHQTHANACAIGDHQYLFPVHDKSGQVAIIEVRDTVFSLLPTACPIPVHTKFGEIVWFTQIMVDREHQRAYMMGFNVEETKKFVLAINYAERPATMKCYYTGQRMASSVTLPVLTPDGNLVITGGFDSNTTNFDPTAEVWLFPLANKELPQAAINTTSSKDYYLLIGAAVLLILVAGGWIYWKRRHRKATPEVVESPSEEATPEVEESPSEEATPEVEESPSEEATPEVEESPSEEAKPVARSPLLPKEATDQLLLRIRQHMDEQRPYLNSELKVRDIANYLGTNSRYISYSIKRVEQCTFSAYINKHRVAYAQQLMRRQPDIKLTEVYLKSGFANEISFFRTFKGITGMTPSEWKAKELANEKGDAF